MTQDVRCPECGSETVVRAAKKGTNAGRRFYVCARYPDCKGKVPIEKQNKETKKAAKTYSDIQKHIEALRDKDAKGAAYKALAKIGKPAVPALIAALKDKDNWVRESASMALGTIGHDAKAAVPTLAEALKDKDFGVRLMAAAALGLIGPAAKAAVPALIGVWMDDDEEAVRAPTAQALERIWGRGWVRLVTRPGKVPVKEQTYAEEPIERKEKDKNVRYCYQCGERVRKGTGYLLQGAIPAWARDMGHSMGFSSKIGTSCEHRSGDHALACWYWYCDRCGSAIRARDIKGIFKNGAGHFWKTGQPPKLPPLWEDRL